LKTGLIQTISAVIFVTLLITIFITSLSVKTAFGGDLLPIRGLTVQFERRGYPNGYYPGDAIRDFSNYDDVVGHTVAIEIALQLDAMKLMGVNTISFELRACDPTYIPEPFVPPNCNLGPSLGFQYPQPTSTELNNLTAFFNLVNSKGIKIILWLNNTHMEEQPPVSNATWISSIINVIKDHPALELVVFGGNTHLVDTDGNGVGDACGLPAEAPLYLGPTSKPAQYVKWAINYARSLGVSPRKLSAEAIIGDFRHDSQIPAGPDATDGHLWPPIAVLKEIFDQLSIPNEQCTYAVSFYEHRKCLWAPDWLPCVDKDPHAWGDETLQRVFDTIGSGNGSRVIAVEMGLNTPVDQTWTTEQALESIISLMGKHGTAGGTFWRWANYENSEDSDPQLASPIKRRGVDLFYYNPIKRVLEKLYKKPANALPFLELLFEEG
jgi:hypothetical protein